MTSIMTNRTAEVVTNATYPIAPVELYKLMFDSEWFENFLKENQKVWDLEFEAWKERDAETNLYMRDFHYTKAVSGAGPKEVVCLEHEENKHRDENDYIETETITNTPGVPYGKSFHVVTHTRINWAEDRNNGSVLNVIVEIVWTGWCPFKGMVEGRVIDGQRDYSKDLDNAIKEKLTAEGLLAPRYPSEKRASRVHFSEPRYISFPTSEKAEGWVSDRESWLEKQSPVPGPRRSRLWTLVFSLLVSMLLGLIAFRLFI